MKYAFSIAIVAGLVGAGSSVLRATRLFAGSGTARQGPPRGAFEREAGS
jgi:hypothetical protein